MRSRPKVISLIAAMSENRVIGRDNRLPWHLPVDLKRYSRMTRGHTIIMGRRTWESLSGPLPQRRNIVITRRADYSARGAEVVTSLDAALALAAEDGEVFVVGGEQVYRLAMPLADRIDLTVVQTRVAGDAYFPEIDPSVWRLAEAHTHAPDHDNALGCVFQTWQRKALNEPRP